MRISTPSLGGLLVQSRRLSCGIFLDRSGGVRQNFPLACVSSQLVQFLSSHGSWQVLDSQSLADYGLCELLIRLCGLRIVDYGVHGFSILQHTGLTQSLKRGLRIKTITKQHKD